MYVSYKQLVEMAKAAFDSGRNGPLEMREQAVDEIIAEAKIGPARDLRVYGVDELKQFAVGSVFHHSFLGRGEIVTKRGVRHPFMKFASGVTLAFTADAFPWDMPMTLVAEAAK